MLGRVLGGIATSLLFSAFESWLVAEHNKVCNCYSVKPAIFRLVVVTIILGFFDFPRKHKQNSTLQKITAFEFTD